ncbi:MAG: hypothetical protein ABR536_01085 [Solirubrobacterales bacterium]
MWARARNESGQSAVEWVGLLALVALLLVVLLHSIDGRLPGAALAESIAERLVCAAKLSGCRRSVDSPLVASYGEEAAVLARRYAPELRYEPGSSAIPVDFRRCRSTVCGDGPRSGPVFLSNTGEQPTAFVHLIHRDGSTYIQYWLYYADSATLRGVPYAGAKGYHLDDWESYQVRAGPGGRGVVTRASSHQGYNGGTSWANPASDAGIETLTGAAESVGLRSQNGWTPARGRVYVSGGSHAGHASEPRPVLRLSDRGLHGREAARMRDLNRLAQWTGYGDRPGRWTPASRLQLVPIEPLAQGCARHQFAISAPWCKKVYVDPEYRGTD